MNELHVVEDTSGRLTLESVGANVVIIVKEEFGRIANIDSPSWEEPYYLQYSKEFLKTVRDTFLSEGNSEGNTSRRIVKTWEPVEGANHCITSLQLLARDNYSVLTCYMRSSDTAKIPIDLGFLCREAIVYGVSELVVFMGSSHTYLEG